MSKRSTRRKRREKQKQKTRLSGPEWIKRGHTALRQADYSEAIQAWEQARRKPDAPKILAAALAEVYFRRAVSAPAPAIEDLKQAVQLQPSDQIYRYHLALAYHRRGELAQAEPLYRQLLAETPPWSRAAEPLAQLLLEQSQTANKDPVWPHLNAEAQTQLAAVETLVAKKVMPGLSEKPLHPLWRGLTALALLDEVVAAQADLQTVVKTGNEAHPLVKGVAHYYLGVIAARADQLETALTRWQTAQSQGLNSEHLRQNLTAIIYEQAIKAQQNGQPQQAADLLEQVDFANNDLKDFRRQLNLELAYAAAQKGDWPQALTRWQKAEQSGDNSRRLVFNLALAYQKTENHRQAAEYWRALLRRRPRKADHPDALTDEQVARIWQNVAENYSLAGDYEEAVTTYKNAVKWAPDNLDLRLQLVEAYQIEGRWQAAENELDRILDKDPNNIRALTLLAESYSEDYFLEPAREIWLRILSLEPQNPVARQQLAQTYVREGVNYNLWGHYKEAVKTFEEGLKHVPHNQRLLTMLGGTYVDWGKLKQGRQYLEEALAVDPNDLHTLYTIFIIWLEHNASQELQQTFERIKAVPQPIPGEFFLDLFEQCQKFNRKKEGRKILEYTEQRFADAADVLVTIAHHYVELEQDSAALSILRRVLRDNPDHIEANIELGVLYYYMDQTRLAKRHWDKAQAQAQREKNPLMAHRVKLVKDEFLHGKTPPRNPLEMLMNLPPHLREQLINQAPPEVAEMLRDPELLAMMSRLGGLGEFDDEDDFYV
ncbi:MAG: tetratricopeptide repeat protein [Anaerolineae bacterium]|nr:tetratricopeptide repeat protein [Anaerolineae bacterium]